MEPNRKQQDEPKEVSLRGDQKILSDLYKAHRKIQDSKNDFMRESQSLSQTTEGVKQRLERENRSLNRNTRYIIEQAHRQWESARKFGFRDEPKMTKKAKRQAQLCKDTAVKLRLQVDKLGVAKDYLVNLRNMLDDESVITNEMNDISSAAVQSLWGITDIQSMEDWENLYDCKTEVVEVELLETPDSDSESEKDHFLSTFKLIM